MNLLKRVLLSFILLLTYEMATGQITSVSFTTPTLFLDGGCVPNSISRFETIVTLSVSGSDTYYVYMVDGNNKVINYVSFNIPWAGTPFRFNTTTIPDNGPFKIFASHDFTAQNNVHTGQEISPIVFDANALDPDCPAASAPMQPESIPTISEWGIMVMSLCMLIFGVVSLKNKRIFPKSL